MSRIEANPTGYLNLCQVVGHEPRRYEDGEGVWEEGMIQGTSRAKGQSRMYHRIRYAALSLVPALLVGRIYGQQSPESDSLQIRIENVDQRVKILERLRELDQEIAQRKSEETPVVTANKDGFIVRAPDTSYQLRIRFEGHFDGRYYLKYQGTQAHTLAARRARPIIEARVPGPFFLRIMADLAGGRADLPDAYLESGFDPRIGVRIGKFKSPFGLEVLQSTAASPLIEWGIASALAPNRDVGVQVQGDFKGVINYALGVFNGAVDGSSIDADWNRAKDLAGRVQVQPFYAFEALKGFGIGAAYTTGSHTDLRTWSSALSPASLPTFRTAGQDQYFRYRDTTLASGNHSRYALQGQYYVGPFGVFGEYISSTQGVVRKLAKQELTNTGWTAGVIYSLTGEASSYRGIRPFTSFDILKGQWGALELVGRVSSVSIDEEAFPVYADSNKFARQALEGAVGLNWHLNRNLKALFNYTQTTFEGGRGDESIPDERVIAGRVQIVL